MSDFINKIIGLFMVFILLVLAPLIINSLSTSLTMKRAVLNEMTNFIDKVTDSGRITAPQKTDFYLGCSSHGVTVDVRIKRYIRVVSSDGAGSTITTYVLSDKIDNWNQGDIIEVEVEAIDYTSAQKLMWYFNRFFPPKIDFQLAGMIR